MSTHIDRTRGDVLSRQIVEGITTVGVVEILSRREERQRKEASQELWYTLVLSELQRLLSWEDHELRANVVSIARPHLKQSFKKRKEWRLGIELSWKSACLHRKSSGPDPQHGIDWAWWLTPGTSALRRYRGKGQMMGILSYVVHSRPAWAT